MKISWLKSNQDFKNFKFVERLGFEVVKLDNQENVDQKIKELIDKEKYNIKELIENKNDTIIITQELAGFSEDIIKKYSKNKDVKIIINKT